MTPDELTQQWMELRDRIKGFIAGRIAQKDDEEDLLQDVFIRIYTKLPQVREETRIAQWIYQVTRNTLIDYHRKKSKDYTTTVELDNYQILSQEREETLTQEFATCIIPMIANLPEKYRTAVHLAEIEGRSQKDLSRELQLSYSGAKSRVQRGRRLLLSDLNDCCLIETDRYGNILHYEKRSTPCPNSPRKP